APSRARGTGSRSCAAPRRRACRWVRSFGARTLAGRDAPGRAGRPAIRALHELHEGLPAVEGVLDLEVVTVIAVEAVGVPALGLRRGDAEGERVSVPGAARGLRWIGAHGVEP